MTDSGPHRIFRELDHTADLRVEIFGHSEEDLFQNAVRTLYSLLGLPVTACTGSSQEGSLMFSGLDREDILVQLLGELLYSAVSEKKRFFPERWAFRKDREDRSESLLLEGTWRSLGTAFTGWKNDIKAVTYHDARIRRGPDGYTATVVMDL